MPSPIGSTDLGGKSCRTSLIPASSAAPRGRAAADGIRPLGSARRLRPAIDGRGRAVRTFRPARPPWRSNKRNAGTSWRLLDQAQDGTDGVLQRHGRIMRAVDAEFPDYASRFLQ